MPPADFNADGRPDLAVANVGGENVSVLLNTSPIAPVITQQPLASQTVQAGQIATISIIADGLGSPLTYQWRRDTFPLSNGGSVAGAASASLSLNPVTFADDGVLFDCIVTNDCGSVTSDTATLTVICRADYDGNQAVAVPDIFAFLAVWFTGAYPASDFNDDQAVNVQDIFAFLSAWFAGCP